MGPFNLPWSTFLAYIVILASIATAIIWAWNEKKKDRDGRGKK